MAIAVVLVLLVIGSLIFHFASPWWFTPIASNWSTMDDTVDVTFWVTGIVFVVVNLFLACGRVEVPPQARAEGALRAREQEARVVADVVTSVGVAAMLTPGLFVWGKFVNVPEDASIVEAVGQQWHWSVPLARRGRRARRTATRRWSRSTIRSASIPRIPRGAGRHPRREPRAAPARRSASQACCCARRTCCTTSRCRSSA